MNKVKEFSISQENFTMQADVQIIEKDILIILTGGTNPHIGTITTRQMNGQIQNTAFPSHDGRFHKDDILARTVIQKISSLLVGNLVVTSGIHVNHISKKQIQASFEMAAILGEQIADWLKDYDFEKVEPPIYL
ncbi:amino acid decarboxylase [Listeria valentina]|uniref:prenylated flavin chaperone LpdD n=1 Tax=Listeria valentina TaxID=2705293 RepID=UPI00142F6024|nr:amino acid decarboxylase [Listeria valentina]